MGNFALCHCKKWYTLLKLVPTKNLNPILTGGGGPNGPPCRHFLNYVVIFHPICPIFCDNCNFSNSTCPGKRKNAKFNFLDIFRNFSKKVSNANATRKNSKIYNLSHFSKHVTYMIQYSYLGML